MSHEMPIKLTYVISDVSRALGFEWIIEEIDKKKIDLSFILIGAQETEMEKFLLRKSVKYIRIEYKSKLSLLNAILKSFLFLKKNRSVAVHTHLFTGSFIGLIAAKLAGIQNRFYTRHYATLNHEYHPKAVKWDKNLNKKATKIIAVSENVKQTLIEREQVDSKKVVVIPHGFKLELFHNPNTEKVKILHSKYNPSNKSPVIGVISRFTELKGVQYIIPAYKELLNSYPNALLLLFNTLGDHEKKIKELLNELPEASYRTVEFENELPSLYHIFDLFVHVPVNKNIEAFGQTYIECLASGIPMIASLSGIAPEVLIDRENCIIVPYRDSNAILNASSLLLNDEILRNKIKTNSYPSVHKLFEIKRMVSQLEELYLQ